MARTVVAIYDGFQRANEAVRELIDNGFPRDNISIVANNASGDYGRVSPATDAAQGQAVANDGKAEEDTGTGAGVGAGIGAAIGGIGGLLVGLGALAIPGIGPVIAAGPLAVALSTLTGAGVGAVAGGVTGGLLGALIGLGIPEEEAEYYTEGVKRGGVLVTVQAEDHDTEQVMDLLNHYQPMDIKQRASEWRSEGWTGASPDAKTVIARPQTFTPLENSPQVNSVAPDSVTQVNAVQSSMPRDNYPQDNRPQANMLQNNRAPDTRQEVTPDLAMTQRAGPGWRQADYNADFNIDSPIYINHYRAFLSDTGSPYDYYVPAYRYGYSMAADNRYQNRRWEQIETDMRRDWEMEHPGTWVRFSSAIRHAWEDAVERQNRL